MSCQVLSSHVPRRFRRFRGFRDPEHPESSVERVENLENVESTESTAAGACRTEFSDVGFDFFVVVGTGGSI